MSILSLIAVLVVIGVLAWAVSRLPLDATIKNIIQVVLVVFAVIWLLQALGLLPGRLTA